MDVYIYGNTPSLGIFSGIHGDEWGIIQCVKTTVEEYKEELKPFLFIPTCSPSAVANKTRENSEKHDLNRSFTKNPTDKEAQEIISILKPYTFNLCVDIHEDLDLPGVYVYDSENIEGSDNLFSFRKQTRDIGIHLYSGIDDISDISLGRKVNEGYRVSLPPQQDENGKYIYEGFFDFWALIEGKTKRWLTLEVPTKLSDQHKLAAVEIFFKTLVLTTRS